MKIYLEFLRLDCLFYFRIKYRRHETENENEKASNSEIINNKSAKETFAKKILEPLEPKYKIKPKKKVKQRAKSDTKLPDLLSKVQHFISGEVVIVTPNLVVTRTSPTPEDKSPMVETMKEVLKF